jgi:Siphovirus Gp157
MLYELDPILDTLDDPELDVEPLTEADEFRRLEAALPGGTAERLLTLVRWQANTRARTEALKEEIAKLTARKRGAEARADLMRRFMGYLMRTAGLHRFDAGVRTLYFRRNPPRIEVDTEEVSAWPAEVLERAKILGVVRESVEVNRTKLKTLPNWEQLPGVTIIEGDEVLGVR